ncbi:MarR family transcriptional regulator [Paenibacillus sp. NRS-1760]|uniref:LexA family protein n=1 Tax=Paenibacillus sp. NRS-1760 TaxID=3233902 RepID=UPI003D275540
MAKSEFAKQLDSLVMTDEQVIAQVKRCLEANMPINISTMLRGLEILIAEQQARPKLATGLKPLNKRQATTFDFLVEFIGKNGYSPSVREIGDAVGLSSSSTVQGHLDRLEEKGYIKRAEGGRPRSLQITGKREVEVNAVRGDRSGD